MPIAYKTCSACKREVPVWTEVGQKCPRCGVLFVYESGPPPEKTNWRKLAKVLAIIVLAIGAFVLIILRAAEMDRRATVRKRQDAMDDIRLMLVSPVQSSRTAALEKMDQYPEFITPLAPQYAQALRTSDPETRIRLINGLAIIGKAGRQGNVPLPDVLVQTLNEARNDKNAEIRDAATKTLSALTNP